MNKLNLLCQNWPTDKQEKKAKRFGEGFVWGCPNCGKVLVLVQGKGDYWYWKQIIWRALND